MNAPWISITGLAALGFAALGALVLYRCGSARIVARFELVRLTRGGRQPLLRGLVALGTLGGLLLAYLRAAGGVPAWEVAFGRFEMPRDRMPEVGETFLFAFLAIQLLAITLAAPVVLAASLAKEKERKTLDDLLLAGFSTWDIVAGKFLAGWLYVLGVAAAGAPALAFATLFGGIDPETLVGGTVVIVYGSAGLGAAAVRAAAWANGLREALAPLTVALTLLAAFGLIAGIVPILAYLSPASSLFWLLVARGAVDAIVLAPLLAGFAFSYAVYVMIALRSGAAFLRAEPPPPPPRAAERQAFPRAVPVYGVEARKPSATATHSTVPDENVFLWKERRPSARSDRGILIALGWAGLMVGVLFVSTVVVSSKKREWVGDSFNPVARLALLTLAVAGPLIAGVRAAGSVARERERQTLDALLSTPASRRDILVAKWLGAQHIPIILIKAVAALLVGISILSGVNPIGALAGFLAAAGTTLAAGSLGLYFSTGARTSYRASLALYGCVFALWVGPVILSPLTPPGVPRDLITCLSPPVGTFRAAGLWRFYQLSPDSDWDAILASTTVGVVGLLAAYTMWHAARRRFEAAGR